jgi:CRISPR system Cascade subunit CasD
MPQFLRLRLEGPLIAFGGETVDARGVIADFPARSFLRGLFANALGWRRSDRDFLSRLQERLAFAARIDREGERLTDFQTAAIGAGDKGWTTLGGPEGRAGGPNTYHSPHIRRRDFNADAAVTVAVTLEPASETPVLEALAEALILPARPLFLAGSLVSPPHRFSSI